MSRVFFFFFFLKTITRRFYTLILRIQQVPVEAFRAAFPTECAYNKTHKDSECFSIFAPVLESAAERMKAHGAIVVRRPENVEDSVLLKDKESVRYMCSVCSSVYKHLTTHSGHRSDARGEKTFTPNPHYYEGRSVPLPEVIFDFVILGCDCFPPFIYVQSLHVSYTRVHFVILYMP